jgi:Gas vesicle protein G
MILVDSLLIGGLRFVLDKVLAAVDSEMTDDGALRAQLLEAQVQRELGEMSEEEYLELEAELLLRIQDLKGGSRAPIAGEGGYKVSGVEATIIGDDH